MSIAAAQPELPEVVSLEGTEPLRMSGDIASTLVEGVDRFLLRELDRSVAQRATLLQRDLSSPANYIESLQPSRERLAHILGMRDRRVPFDGPQLAATTERPALVGRGERIKVFAVSWPAVGDIEAEGLLLAPNVDRPLADVVALPDADQSPEQIVGLTEGVAPESQFARRLAESGCRVLVPTLISRRRAQFEWSGRRVDLTNREFLYRSSFELGRHLIGYELHKALAGVDWFQRTGGGAPIGVIGYGEGGMLAMYAAALDPRIAATCVSGYFDARETIWQQPIDRNVFGLLERFGDAELAAMIAPRALIVEAAQGPQFELPPGTPGAPARLVTPEVDSVRREFERAQALTAELQPSPKLELVVSGNGDSPPGSDAALSSLLEALHPGAELASAGAPPTRLVEQFDVDRRMHRQMRQIDRHNQWLLRESAYVRSERMKDLDFGSLEKYAKSIEPHRRFFAEQVIGRFDHTLLPPNVRTRRTYEQEEWTGYEVVLDVFPDVIAYGILLLPNDIQRGERRPVVVCQHGLEGRPQHVIGEENYGAYKAFAAQLAERGFVTFAPQNLYIFRDRFRTLQRKANPLGKTLFSVMVPQHQQITDWLASLPMVDPQRIAFYGLSYGGKSAMRIPPLVDNYCLSICSADFNEWVWKNASTRARYSYVWTGEYEIFEFDLGSTFNYAEMAALIAPRPFMVERGHFDGVAPDEAVGFEFAKVRHLYQARLGIGDRCRIEWFVGPHTINGRGTFEFLHQHLDWPAEQAGE